MLLGAWPDGDTVFVADNGATRPAPGTPARDGHHPAELGRLAVLAAEPAADLLRVLAEAHTGQPPRPVPAERPLDPAGHTTVGVGQATPPPADQTSAGTDTAGPAADRDGANGDAAADRADANLRDADPADADLAGPDLAGADVGGGNLADTDVADVARGKVQRADGLQVPAAPAVRVQANLLGPPAIADAPPGERLRPQAVELLVYLAVRGGAASQDAVLEDLLPDAPQRKAPHRLHTYIYNLRRICRLIGGPGSYVQHPHGRYVLNPDAFDLDLWRLRDGIAEATKATDAKTRVAALRRAVAAYTGPLAEGRSYEWIEPYREAVRLQAVDAALALADALTDDPDQAVDVLTAAIGHHPYTEALYQAAMRAHARRGDADAIRTLLRTLASRLNDLDTEPDDETITLADQCLAEAKQRNATGSGGAATGHHPRSTR